MNKVIFLDVDGVLNCCDTEARSPMGFIGIGDRQMKCLKKVVDSTGAKIVLTSTWKSEWDIDPKKCEEDGAYLNSVFREYGLSIRDKTEDYVSDRGAGIVRYLKAHPEIASWVVLDDDIFGDYDEYGIMPHLVHTSFGYDGLTDSLADQAIELLIANEMEESE